MPPKKAGAAGASRAARTATTPAQQLLDIALGLFARRGIVEDHARRDRERGGRHAGDGSTITSRPATSWSTYSSTNVSSRCAPSSTGRSPNRSRSRRRVEAFAQALVATVDKHPARFAAPGARGDQRRAALLRQRIAERFGDAHQKATIERIER